MSDLISSNDDNNRLPLKDLSQSANVTNQSVKRNSSHFLQAQTSTMFAGATLNNCTFNFHYNSSGESSSTITKRRRVMIESDDEN